MKIIIPGEFPSLNEIIKKAKSHHMAYASMKKENTQLVQMIANRLPNMERVYLDITYYCKNRRKDPDNIAAAKKFILDGLVAAEVIPNDGWKEIDSWEEKFKVDKNNPRIEINIKEVD
ncbi:RusA family crossover junction endodeoxyribonuclease [Halocella sp. SP3-1]|uniref:RusA family crossover junction endodeoxyribonuclease n=1 Tax=Halocella sp. SP3-1 TaxID=2382161 RepID=UPI000F75034A|nr:RusA family crossover junction endodeoxyribonuclease [Halocella sp. SP3-1]AZO96157.1 RusA family crossover junction endodeoxyribonuclease [Halocella sp. SP3-1]